MTRAYYGSQEGELSDIDRQIAQLEAGIAEKQEQLIKLRKQAVGGVIKEYTFEGSQNSQNTLSSFFGKHSDLIVIHNMGSSCPYCTLWADGYNGFLKHIESRAGFVVVSPDRPDTQEKIKHERGWQFNMVSNGSSGFTEDMGFKRDDQWIPGVSTFKRTDSGDIHLVAQSSFGPGDPFCSIWHFFALLDQGTNKWTPKFSY